MTTAQLSQPHIAGTEIISGKIDRFFDFLPQNDLLRYFIGLAIIIFLIFLLKYIAKLLQNLTEAFLLKRGYINRGWLSIIAKNKLLGNIFFWIGMVFLSSISAAFLQNSYPKTSAVVTRLLNSFVLVSLMLAISSALSALSDKFSSAMKLPIKGITQAAKIVLWILTVLMIIAVLVNKDPMLLLGGLTALSAITMLIFKDSILGLTSGFQLLMNDLIRVGDWIEIPSQGADGNVIDIMLTTVRVQNWDNTIVNVPAYNLVANSFTNWRGMSESGGRRIKRSININVQTIRFLNDDDVKRLEKINLLKDYLTQKKNELKESNAKLGSDADNYNARRLSNIGLFRRYCYEYLKRNPNISDKFTCMVRQLPPTSEGMPLEVYAFSNNINWVDYEGIQSDIFDHFLSIINLFDLKAYQRSSDISSS
ncbi:MAG: mechanosensitive ion channel family protein [Elusimicrobiota bacterium]|jgi:miniconductance mechanosensitive channel|nr:mechanosensitive ion channel family protein [Elusimicrobiota bacterium]